MNNQTTRPEASLIEHMLLQRGMSKWIAAAGVLPVLILFGTHAAHAAEDTAPPDRLASLIVFKSETCHPSQATDIMVCGHQPESERYRIPEALRETIFQPPAQSWASRVRTLDDASRATRPNSCSVVETGGQSGCYSYTLEEWRAQNR